MKTMIGLSVLIWQKTSEYQENSKSHNLTFNMNLQSLLIVHLFIANVSIHCSAIFSKERICIYLQTCLEFDTFNSLKGFVRIRAFQLTLYLMEGGIECLPLAKVAPVH